MTNSDFIFAVADLPPIPDWVLDEVNIALINKDNPIRETLKNCSISDYNRKTKTGPGRWVNHMAGFFQAIQGVKYQLPEAVKKWAKENISTEALAIEVWEAIPYGQILLAPHSDGNVRFNMLYLLDAGSELHSTPFFKRKNSDEIVIQRGQRDDNYDELEELCRFRLPINKWIIFDGHVIHSTEQIAAGRSSIHIRLHEIPSDVTFKNKIYVTK